MSNVVDITSKGGKEGRKPRGRKERPVDHSTFERLLQHFALIYSTDTVIDIQRRLVMKIGALRLAYGVDMVKMWLNSPSRITIQPDQLVFDPTCKARPPAVNLFDKLPLAPDKGECGKIQLLLLHLCGGRPDIMLWIERWAAYPLRNPGAKMRTAVLMYGDEGSGKNLFWDVLLAIYGEYGLTISQDQVESKYNDWMSRRLFIVADEVVTRGEMIHHKGRLKGYITAPTVMIEGKNLPVRSESNHLNLVFLSNETQPLVIDDSDRRYMVIRTPPAQSKDYYKEVAAEIAGGGIAAYLHYLLNELDMGEFEPHSKPILNDDKTTLAALSAPAPRRFFDEWFGGMLPIPWVSTSTPLLYRAFDRWCGMTGERWPPSQQRFIAEIERHVMSRAVDARKVPRAWLHLQDEQGRGTERVQRAVFRVGRPPDGQSEIDWLDDQVGLFIGGLKSMGAVGWRM